jgi:cytochrome c oxidase subunit 2
MSLAIDTPSPLDPEGRGARILGQEITFQLVAGSAVLLLVLAILLAIVLRRRAATQERPPQLDDETGRRWIWLGGVALPLVLLTALAAFGARSLLALGNEDDPVRTIQVFSHRWWWEVRYPGERIATANELVIPVGRPVRLLLSTKDVIHSFWVPQLDRKVDMVPGRVSKLTLTAEHPGVYRGECAEFCGLQHARMGFRVKAVSPGEFAGWLAAARAPSVLPAGPTEREGMRTFLDGGCAVCHTISGTPAAGTVGPDLSHIASRDRIAAETLRNTRGNLGAWISDPQHVKRGALMPRLDLSGAQLQALLDYLETLR